MPQRQFKILLQKKADRRQALSKLQIHPFCLHSFCSSLLKMDDPKVQFILCCLFLLIVSSSQLVCGFKSEEFRKCKQAPFCMEARDRKPGSSDVYVSEIIAQDGLVTANLLSASESNGTAGALILQMIVYKDGILRVRVREESAPPGGKVRFEVPDVLVQDLEDRRLWIQRIAAENGVSVFYLSPGHEVVVQHNPFQINVRKGNEHLVSFNSKGLFHFEQLREKQEGENWEETFRGHRDSRSHGPQSVSFDVSFHNSDHVYGIPEHATRLALKPTRGTEEYSEPYRLFNLDVFEYLEESPFGLYGSIPFMLSHNQKRTTGFFWLNAAEMLIDVLSPGWDKESADGEKTVASGVDTHWISESGALDAFILIGPSPKDVVKQYTSLTGTTTLPQYFATAYHQCRWNYRDEADVKHVDSKFDEYDIPYDVIWLDIEHTDGKKYFTWDPILFPHPEEMQKNIANKGRHMVTIVDPHIKRDDGYWIHKEATAEGYYVKDTQGHDYDGWCWPGSSSYLDMVDPAIRSWWADKFSLSSYKGSTPILYIWNDMNEPSVFNGPEASMPRDNLHYGGVENRDVHNAYGYYFHMASAEGLFRRGGGNDRPFVLSRAFFAGTQRVGPVWTGDNTADWDHLRVSVPMVLTLGLTGMAFTGADVGGFFGNPDPELLTRWYQLGAFYPFFRAHAHLDTKRREPWLFGEPYTSLIRNAIHTRYALLPYYYTLFKEASITGVPVMRPLWMEFPEDASTYAMDDQFMIGQGLLVCGIFAEGISEESVYLPGNQPWYHYETGAEYAGGQHHKLPVTLDSIPVFQKSGTIIPRKDRLRRSTTQMERDPFTLVVALNTSKEAEGELYIDDGKSYDFEKGVFVHRKFIFSKGRLNSSSLRARDKSKQGFSSSSLVDRIVILGLKSEGWEGKHRALIESVDQKVDVERGPTILRQGAISNAIVIRMPKVAIVDDWSIQLQ